MAAINVSLRDFAIAGSLRLPAGVSLEISPYVPTKSGDKLVTVRPDVVPLPDGDGTLNVDAGYYWVGFRGTGYVLSSKRLIWVTGDADLVDLWLAPIDPNTLVATPDVVAAWVAALAGTVQKNQNLADLPDKAAARTNLGVPSVATVQGIALVQALIYGA